MDGSNSWTHAVAGCVAGLASTLVLQPLDVVKTRLQVQDGVARSLGPRATSYRGTAHALASIARTEGWLALYAGLAPALLGAGLSWGAYFAAYSAAKERWVSRLGGGVGGGGGGGGGGFFSSTSTSSASSPASSSPFSSSSFSLPAAAHMAAAAEAGAIVAVLTNPVWVVKTRLQLQARGGLSPPPPAPSSPTTAAAAATTTTTAAAKARTTAAARSAAPPRPPRPPLRRYGGGVRGTVRAIIAEEGVRGLYRGLLPSLLLVSHGAIQFAVYEELKRLLRNSNHLSSSSSSGSDGNSSSAVSGNDAPPPLASHAVAVAGAASKVAACVATYPAQVLRARLQQKQLPVTSGAAVVAAAAANAATKGGVVPHPPRVPLSAAAVAKSAAAGAMSSAVVVRYDRLLSAFRTILRREGVWGLYKGLSPTLLRVVPQSALTFVAYERVLSLLQAAAGRVQLSREA